MPKRRIGAQEPRIKVEPKRDTTDGDGAAMLMAGYGNTLDPWQELVVNCWLGKKDDQYNVTSAGLGVPRQNGKNVCLEAREFYGLVINGEKILHTAHQVRTAKKSFLRLEKMFTNRKHPEIMALVKKIRYTNGEEGIELVNGGQIEFSARSRQAARGFDGISLVVYDEAQELTDDQVEAIMAVLAASETGTRQIIYTGTPPYPNCPGTVFKRIRKTCLTKPGIHDAWHEWSVEGKSIEDIKLDNVDIWYDVNPSLGLHLTEDFTRTELTTETADGFARERLGWWMPSASDDINLAIDKESWMACASKLPKPSGKTAFGIKLSTDGSLVCLAGAVIPTEGPARISIIEYRNTARGLKWLSEWLNERYEKASAVAIDGRNNVDLIVDRIKDTWRAKDSVIKPTAANVVAATSCLIEAVNEQDLTWYEPQYQLSDSALSATKRPIGGGFGFGGDDSLPIEAAALAFWAAKTSKRDPNRKMRVG